uniref:Uncharacterized protein n=1 Tax=Rhizophora mucronata TaxID=61149 RepID=A0A2P2PDG8_RHIMU
MSQKLMSSNLYSLSFPKLHRGTWITTSK